MKRSQGNLRLALTFDDLPCHGGLAYGETRQQIGTRILDSLDQYQCRGIFGFLNGVHCDREAQLTKILHEWRERGHFLGNHTYFHRGAHECSLEEFTTSIIRNEVLLKRWMKNLDFRWFRYPYLSEGETLEKRKSIRSLLHQRGYRIAPVSIDSHDWRWQEFCTSSTTLNQTRQTDQLMRRFIASTLTTIFTYQSLTRETLGRDISHVFLLHFGSFTSRVLNPLLHAFKENRVELISLEEATADHIY